MLESMGGVVDEEGHALGAWIGEFLRHPDRKDVLAKLARSGAAERHVFVPVAWGGAPSPVWSYLATELTRFPDEPPLLPEPVTAVWVTSTHSPHGIRWDGTQWYRFDARPA